MEHVRRETGIYFDRIMLGLDSGLIFPDILNIVAGIIPVFHDRGGLVVRQIVDSFKFCNHLNHLYPLGNELHPKS